VALGAGGEVLAEATSMRGSGGRSTAGATVGGGTSARFASVLTLDDAALSFDAGTALTFAAGAARRLITSSSGFKFLLPYEGPTAGTLVLIGVGFCVGGLLAGSAFVAVVVTFVSDAVCAAGL